jgi:aspartyl-tRNA(Asn)/glutamyl-tRNA(Gln) amidotransferase subunit A
VRIPAVWNDLVGLKTTSGRLSLDGVVPLCASFDTVGPLCRSVEDAALLYGVLAGEAAPDLAGVSVQGARLAVLDTIAFDDMRTEPHAAFDDALARLKRAGAEVSHVGFPPLTEAFQLAGPLYGAESYGWWRDLVEARPEVMFPQILERVRGGKQIMAADYVAGWNRLRAIRTEYAAAMASYDAVIMPTAPILPPDAARLLEDDAYYKTENLLALRNTRIANLMDLTALTLPTGAPSCGFMFNASRGAEAALLRLGAAAEKALG